MAGIANVPLELRLILLFVVGLLVGRQVNRGIYSLAWFPRVLGPWSPPPPGAPPRRTLDRLPVVGWWGLRRESAWHGAGYWIRPLLIELATGAGFAGLYWWEVGQRSLWPAGGAPGMAALHLQYLSHLVLVSLMLVATFIDFDEQTIPDEITLTGTAVGVILAALFPAVALPTIYEPFDGATSVHQIVLTSSTTSPLMWRDGLGGPDSWPPVLDGGAGLGCGLLVVWTWCFAILHKTWTLRRGVWKAVQYAVASVVRGRTWRVPAALGACLSAVVVLTWLRGAVWWESLLSSLVGMCFGGGLIWSVRIVGGHALRVEAMGFGDVTLMAMIGAFLGWQSAFLIFFLAPFTALLIAAAQRLLTGQRHIAFGPYLCLATLIILLYWHAVWIEWARLMFSLGWFIPVLLICCLVLMGGMLHLWRLIRDAFTYD
ncbi:MAG: prepilin peptidase [Planctomycetaceae bacterium]|nr:prepilin peptidase [Planctomycetaceae bacterium]